MIISPQFYFSELEHMYHTIKKSRSLNSVYVPVQKIQVPCKDETSIVFETMSRFMFIIFVVSGFPAEFSLILVKEFKEPKIYL